MEVLEEEKVKIDSCFLPAYIYEMILKGKIDTPQIEIELGSSFEIRSHIQDFEKVSISEIDMEQEELMGFSELELAKRGIILVKRYKLVNRLNDFLPFYPQTRMRIDGQSENYAWVQIKKI